MSSWFAFSRFFQAIIVSEDFQRFFDRSTRLVERALCEMSEANLFVDYTGAYADDDSEGLDGDKSGEPSVLLVGKQISVCLPGTKLTPHETQPYLYTL